MTLSEEDHDRIWFEHVENDLLGPLGLRAVLIPEDDAEFSTLTVKEKSAIRRHNRDVNKVLRGLEQALENWRNALEDK